MEEAVRDADVLVIGVPSHCVRATLQAVAPYVRPWIPIVSLTKGLEQGTLHAHDGGDRRHRCRATRRACSPVPTWRRRSWPGYAAATVIAMPTTTSPRPCRRCSPAAAFRVYTNHDVIGCEVGGALKNVIAIAAGMATGLGVGDNTRAMVITRGLAELTRLGVAMGGDAGRSPG